MVVVGRVPLPDALRRGRRSTLDDTTALPAQRWWRGQDPDPVVVRRMFGDEGRTEVEIAAAMKISRARLAAALTE